MRKERVKNLRNYFELRTGLTDRDDPEYKKLWRRFKKLIQKNK